MKNYLTKLSILSLLLLPMSALAIGDLNLLSGTVVNVGGINLTVTGATIDQIVVGANSFNATVSNGSYITVVSTDKRTMTVTSPSAISNTLTCNSGDSTYTIGNPTNGATGVVITVTPNSTTCTTSSGSGGGGGGGGGGSAGSPGPAMGASAPSASAPVASVTPAVTTTAPVTVGTRAAVLAGFTDQLTVLAQSVRSLAPGTSAAVLDSLSQQLAVIAAALQSLQSAPSVAPSLPAVASAIARQVFFGQRSNDIKIIQQAFASDPTIYTGPITGLFGNGTRAAIQKFQAKYFGLKAGDVGFGVFGPKTMAKFNEVYGGAVIQ